MAHYPALNSLFGIALPDEYDEQISFVLTPDNHLIVAHPHLPSLILDEENMKFVEISPVKN